MGNLDYKGNSMLLQYSHKDVFELLATLLQGSHSGLHTKSAVCWAEGFFTFLICSWVSEYICHYFQILTGYL